MLVNISLTSCHWQRPYFIYYSACILDKKFKFLKIKQNAEIFKRNFKTLPYKMACYRLPDHPYDSHHPLPLKESWLLQRSATT